MSHLQESTATDVLAAGFVAFNDDCVIQLVNPTAARWLGYAPDELAGQRLDVLLPGGGLLYLQSQILPVLRLQGTLEELYLVLRDQAGDSVPVLINASRAQRAEGVRNEFVFLRMSRRAQLEDELLQAKKLAEQANEAKASFLATMSHELRTPLQTISLGSEMLLAGEHGALTPEQQTVVAASDSAARSLTDLIDDILNFARMQTGQNQVALQRLPAEDVLQRAETLMRHRFEQAGLHYERQSVAHGLAVRCDPRRVQQVILNLLNNALKFTPAGGRVVTSAVGAGEWVDIHVSDTGVGIPEHDLRRIFSPFVQLPTPLQQNQKRGLGLGLAISRELSHAMGGELSVRSTVGQGTTFTFRLPAWAAIQPE